MSKLLRVAVSAILFTWIAWGTDWEKVGASFSRLHLSLWLAAVGLLGITQVVSSLRWKLLASPLRFNHSLVQLSAYYLIGMFFNLVMPTSVGGDVVRAWYLSTPSRRKLAAFVSVFLDRLSGLLVLLVLACLAVTFSPLELQSWIPWTVWGLAAAGFLGLPLLPWLASWGPNGKHRAEQVRTTWRLIRSPGLLLATTLLSLFVQVANVVIVWLVGRALNLDVPGSFYWVMVPMVSLLTLLPISVNGMGVREGAIVLLLAPLGIDKTAALSLAFLWFAVLVVLSLMGGLVYLFGQYARPQETADIPLEDASHGSLDCDPDQGRAGQSRQAA